VYDRIRINTGITGVAFEELQDSFRNVAQAVPNDFADVGVAIQDLNTRLGLTGDPLEELAIQLLTVSRLMGGDVETNVRNATRLFGDWGITLEEQQDTLDLFFKVAQSSGMPFNRLMELVVQSGATFRNYGFSVSESAVLLGRFEREGVNLETVMSGLREAQGRILATGGDLPTMFREIIGEVMTLEDEGAALNLAMEYFGATAGPDMFDTMRNGKLDVDELLAAVLESDETIMGAASATDGFRESWDKFKNYIKLTLEPVSEAVFANLELLIADLTPAVDRVKEAFEEDGLEGALAQLAIEWDKIYKDKLEPLWIKFLEFLNDVVKPIALELGKDIGSAIASGMWSAFKAGVSRLFGPALGESLLGDLSNFELSGPDRGPSLLDRLRTEGYQGGLFDLPTRPDASETRDMLRLGAGGLVTSPVMAQVGEAGPEVVIPLDRFERQYGSGSGDVYLTVNGALDAEGTARTILRVLRDAERRSGDRLTVGG
jgi:hypothetical protein